MSFATSRISRFKKNYAQGTKFNSLVFIYAVNVTSTLHRMKTLKYLDYLKGLLLRWPLDNGSTTLKQLQHTIRSHYICKVRWYETG